MDTNNDAECETNAACYSRHSTSECVSLVVNFIPIFRAWRGRGFIHKIRKNTVRYSCVNDGLQIAQKLSVLNLIGLKSFL